MPIDNMPLGNAIAMNRFGLGARPDQNINGDPVRWLWEQLENYDPAPPAIAALPSHKEIARDYVNDRKKSQALRVFRKNGASSDTVAMNKIEQERDESRQKVRSYYPDAIKARLITAVQSENDFAEHLVYFWSNHFAISVENIRVIGFAGNYEFNAIRPNILGSFKNLLTAAITHPAMLLYLDQAQSVGPNSILAQRYNSKRKKKLGLNENLAREVLELYSLGVRTGYDQNDVTELARALTGLTIAGIHTGAGVVNRLTENKPAGDTVFVDAIHEPGTREIMGKEYVSRNYEGGQKQLTAIIDDLSKHPATARHIATKLARHFIKEPPPSIITALEREFLQSGGNLPALYKIIIQSSASWPDKWEASQAKFKSPWEWTVSAMRGLGLNSLPGNGREIPVFRTLSQPIWKPGSPAGYDDDDNTWLGGSAMLRRAELASRMARQSNISDPRKLAKTLLPDVISPYSMEMISRAASPQQGIALLLLSPEFLRR